MEDGRWEKLGHKSWKLEAKSREPPGKKSGRCRPHGSGFIYDRVPLLIIEPKVRPAIAVKMMPSAMKIAIRMN